ncbi:ubiquinone anaerobic biosynthesis accessory factor UbiT [Spiribacter halobius]|nr:SCP2 sterol-binding domain-containing protein [Spiribacter halobius]UEX79722.1 SCP2 sterol-binding domain-containing protein [Spiribacter halobius]
MTPIARPAAVPSLPALDALLRLPAEAALNHALAASLSDGRLGFLEGRVLVLEVQGIGLRLALTVLRGRLLVLPPATAADTVIRGPAAIFVGLARRRLDPDTAFFQRRLVVEGDTELALAAKNALDGIDAEALPPLLRRALRL